MSKPARADREIVDMLAAAPERIATITAGLTSAQLASPPAPGAWSISEVLAHLRACADVWGDAITTILVLNHPTLRAVNPRTWIDTTDYRRQDFVVSLQAFIKQRDELVATLEQLAPEDWGRSATVTGAGKPLERTVRFYAHWLAEHERPHIKQIERSAGGAAAP